jgi:hypothetical protein
MNRRQMLKAGATAAAFSSVALPQEGSAWRPAALSSAQNETVILLTELIIPATDTPGAKAANVNRYIDLFLSEGPASERDRFLSGLTWLDDYSVKEAGAVFAKLPPAKQAGILERLDAGEDSLPEGNQFFRMIKSMTARFYYQTAIGFKELNKHGVPGGFGCKHDAHNR